MNLLRLSGFDAHSKGEVAGSHHLPPDAEQTAECVREVTNAEELASSVQARIVTDRYLDHSESGFIEFSSHLDANNAASRFQFDRVEVLPAKETEVTVDVADRKMKRPAHDLSVCGSNQ